jgi:hypothetical protein
LQLFRCNKSEKLRSFGSFMAKSFVSVAICAVATACASSNYMGISLAPGAAPTDVQRLAAGAQAGDKHAQLELGERFEAGQGVPADRSRAIRLYRMAASDSGGTLWVYSPSPGGGAPARVIAIDRGLEKSGLPEARDRFLR